MSIKMGTPDTTDETSLNCDLDFINPEALYDNIYVLNMFKNYVSKKLQLDFQNKYGFRGTYINRL